MSSRTEGTVARRVRTAMRPLLNSITRRALRSTRKARWGNLRRRRPFSERFGFERGTPVDRHYIQHFLGLHRDDIRGDVLEVRDTRYTDAFGGDAVARSHVVDLDPLNDEATIVVDLCDPGSLPAATFDCFVGTQTLQYLADVDAALRNVWQSLRPDGTMLLSVPAVCKLDETAVVRDLWRFTPAGLEEAVRHSCPDATFNISAYGNLTASIAFLSGLAAEELRADEIDRVDPDFPVVSCARVRKGSG